MTKLRTAASALAVAAVIVGAAMQPAAARGHVSVGIGFLFPAVSVTLITLVTLSLFRWVEARMPGQHFADHMLAFPVEAAPGEAEVLVAPSSLSRLI